MQGPTTLKLRARSTKGGEGRISRFSSTTDQTYLQGRKKAKPEMASFKLIAGNSREVIVSTPEKRTFEAVRLFFPTQPQTVEIDLIESQSSGAKKRWDI